jgi:bifunctional non-homologous end joining protein LigD
VDGLGGEGPLKAALRPPRVARNSLALMAARRSVKTARSAARGPARRATPRKATTRKGRRAAAGRKPRSRPSADKKLTAYRLKRNFDITPEPSGGTIPASGLPRFVVQKHDATRLHYDFRLEADGVLKSWAIPKGPSLDPADKRLAVRTEDHPMDYIDFEGVIPEGEYGGGPVIVWDQGAYLNIKTDRRGEPVSMTDAITMGTVEVFLQGEKLRGGFALVRTRPGPGGKEHWLLIKMRDEHARPGSRLIEDQPESVRSGRTVEQVVAQEGSPFQVRKKLARARQRQQEGELGERAAPRGRPRTSKRRTPAIVPSADPAPSRNRARTPVPRWIDPMLATLVESPPPEAEKGEWLFEPKLDGFRALAFRDGASVRLLSRNKKDLGERFPEIIEALGRQPLDRFITDGEVVALDRRGISSFSALQQRLSPISLDGARRSGTPLYYYIFDLLHARGHDTRDLPQAERSRLLRRAIAFEDPLRPTEQLTGDPAQLLARACRKGWEGLIGKRADRPYTAGRVRHWIKLKCLLSQEFVIAGYTDPGGSRTAFGSLLLGYYDDGRLIYAGKVGTGYTERMLRDLLKRLKPLEAPALALKRDPSLPRKGVHPVFPRLVASVAFTEWTHDGHIRHPRFLGLREDKDPAAVVRERPAR